MLVGVRAGKISGATVVGVTVEDEVEDEVGAEAGGAVGEIGTESVSEIVDEAGDVAVGEIIAGSTSVSVAGAGPEPGVAWGKSSGAERGVAVAKGDCVCALLWPTEVNGKTIAIISNRLSHLYPCIYRHI